MQQSRELFGRCLLLVAMAKLTISKPSKPLFGRREGERKELKQTMQICGGYYVKSPGKVQLRSIRSILNNIRKENSTNGFLSMG